MVGTIYMIKHKHFHIVYVGSTMQSPKNRWAMHRYALKSKCYSISVYKYMRHYGAENFEFKVLGTYDVVSKDHLFMYEQLWMNKSYPCVNKIQTFDHIPYIHRTRKNITTVSSKK